jgi:hypothetical protein
MQDANAAVHLIQQNHGVFYRNFRGYYDLIFRLVSKQGTRKLLSKAAP